MMLPDFEDVINMYSELNPFEDMGLYSDDIKSIYIVGSIAKGTHDENSDIDIAIVFNENDNETGITSLKLTEIMHQNHGNNMPIWDGRDVDIQIFFNTDLDILRYSKIQLDRQYKIESMSI